MWFELGLRWLLCTPVEENGFQGKDRNADVRRTEPLVVAAETKKMSRLAKDGLLTSHIIKLLEYGGLHSIAASPTGSGPFEVSSLQPDSRRKKR